MNEVLNVQQACEFLKIAKPTLYRCVRKGQIPAFKIGKALRFHKNSLTLWIEQRVTEDTQERKDKIRGIPKEEVKAKLDELTTRSVLEKGK